ncbi:lytic murein transglycosylase [Xinfangfangia sp. D13-10-4-6]|uniref:lytic murein transglycosylase n=1 Tax=Pseudogemmobacter hezensis TaxID=2737662 RepID=UPI001556E600|nr:lytic murein transglycosylase [Pseudogemmobacter hezensis]NPD15874.1 lytic murein transglycosylase [Pseudogemmobacter hezensis]
MISRRVFTLTAGSALLAGCVGGAPRMGGVATGSRETPAPRAVPNAGWTTWVQNYRNRAATRGISAGTLDAAFRHAGFLPEVIEKDRNQTEFKRSLEDYLAIAASDERVSLGREMYARYGSVLSAIGARYGVEGNVVCAFWGLESFYGTRRGNVPVISALSTLAYEGRRAAFFESQLDGAMRILQAGDIPADRMLGSWAGAMGHTQFIPTSYLQYAVDFTGDGRRDIWSDDPTDALASTANYVSRTGWQRGLPWGMEVVLPQGFNAGLLGRGKGQSAADWAALGVSRAGGGALAAGSIIAPGGVGTPAFLLTQNFNVILRYNNAENYAIGVGHLADRIIGGGPVRAAFGPDANGLTKADRQDLQRRLTARGFDTGGSDGVIGPKSREAIMAFQKSRGIEANGVPSPALLAALR